MKRAAIVMIGILLIGSFPTAGHAATLELIMVTRPGVPFGTAGTWDLWARTSSGDNDGIAGYNIEILNSDETTHNIIAQGVPLPPPLSPVLATGFTINDDSNDVLFGGQNSTNTDTILYGVGSPDFVVTESPGLTNFGMPPVGATFAPVLIASGTGDSFTVDIGSASGNVWSRGAAVGRTTDAESADVLVSVRGFVWPEPTSAVIALATCAGMLTIRRQQPDS